MFCRSISKFRNIKFANALLFKAHNHTQPNFPGINANCAFVNKLEFIEPDKREGIPIYSVLGENGQIIEPEQNDPKLDDATLLQMMRVMIQLNQFDRIMYESQRQGRISFYMTSYGEEATHVGTAAALHERDTVFSQYREAGMVLWRGITIEQMMDQCYSSRDDENKGRQMPVHYGFADKNLVSISSSLATQMPNAVGTAYGFKLGNEQRCVLCYFGEGAASEGDFHAAMNFAATLECPIVFLCRNNGYAISTPVREQYRGDGIASRGSGYGMITIRINGNDIFAVYNAVRAAREMSIAENRPVLIEAMTYRIGHHSTSDDSSAYRSTDEVDHWTKESPIGKFEAHLSQQRGLFDKQAAESWNKECLQTVMHCLKKVEAKPKPAILSGMFEDVWQEMPARLRQQRDQVSAHLEKYRQQYLPTIDKFQKE